MSITPTLQASLATEPHGKQAQSAALCMSQLVEYRALTSGMQQQQQQAALDAQSSVRPPDRQPVGPLFSFQESMLSARETVQKQVSDG